MVNLENNEFFYETQHFIHKHVFVGFNIFLVLDINVLRRRSRKSNKIIRMLDVMMYVYL